jgi:hypothetical protein
VYYTIVASLCGWDPTDVNAEHSVSGWAARVRVEGRVLLLVLVVVLGVLGVGVVLGGGGVVMMMVLLMPMRLMMVVDIL